MPTTCKGNNQLGKPGTPLELLQAEFRDDEGEPILGMPVRFDLVKGKGELTVSDDRTDLSGGVCAEFIPADMTGRGRIELRYGDNLENMVPFVFTMEGAEEEAAKPLPTPPPVAPTVIEPVQPKEAPIPAPIKVKASTTTVRTRVPYAPKKKPDPRQIEAEKAFFTGTPTHGPISFVRSKTVQLLIAAMVLAMTVPVYAFVSAVNRPVSVPVDLVVDCTQGQKPRAEGHQLVYDDCQLFRK